MRQVANSWGQTVDKRSFEERKAFVQEHLELVLDSAEKPLEGQRCVAALRHPSHQFPRHCMPLAQALL